MEITSKSPKENSRVAELILEKLNKKNSNTLLLKGELGSGKTNITQHISKLLNITNTVNSPTFVIQKIYDCGKNEYGFKKLYHIDLYRLTTKEEVMDIELFEDLENNKNLFVVEWPEKVEDVIHNTVLVEIEKVKNNTRRFNIS